MGLSPQFLFSNPYLITVQLQIEEISRKLRTGDLGMHLEAGERFETKLQLQVIACVHLKILIGDSRTMTDNFHNSIHIFLFHKQIFLN